MAVLDLVTQQDLTIRVDAGKNFSVKIAGLENLDVAYTMVLTATGSTITKTVGSGITIDSLDNSITITFTGAEIVKKRYTGTLVSDDEDADVFLKINTILETV